ncbi:hypothetical protein [Bacillus thuringiensis]|uniref:hypothetical protein n=1 Tax=Bacillus thuringiensis TaxID=1428 RepID=UPI000BFDD3F5|nr:hypothetical protein [Bacillus thuringiensis]PGT89888.1 hypothetical protein COD17_09055 [Bacillus thuringiensis]
MTEIKYCDKMQVKDMKDGVAYPITQGDNGYSDGVWATKNGDEIRLRHFWETGGDGYMAENGVYVDDDNDVDSTDVIHKDVMQVIPDAISYTFEEMTLAEFYEVVSIGLWDLEMDGDFVLPKHLKGKYVTYKRDGKVKKEY